MFMSQYYHTVDAKGRLIVPAKYREQLGDEFVITKGLDGCLFVYGNADWEILEKKLTSLPVTNANARKLTRFFLAGATVCEVDQAGADSDPGGFERICGSGKRRSFSRAGNLD